MPSSSFIVPCYSSAMLDSFTPVSQNKLVDTVTHLSLSHYSIEILSCQFFNEVLSSIGPPLLSLNPFPLVMFQVTLRSPSFYHFWKNRYPTCSTRTTDVSHSCTLFLKSCKKLSASNFRFSKSKKIYLTNLTILVSVRGRAYGCPTVVKSSGFKCCFRYIRQNRMFYFIVWESGLGYLVYLNGFPLI